MKRGQRQVWLWILIVIVVSVWSRPLDARQGAATNASESFLSTSAPFTAWTAQISMRDGKALAADVYTPKSVGKYPVVLVQTPYNKNQLRLAFEGKGRYGAQSLFTDASYAFVVTDWRGKFASQSAQLPGKQPNLGEDGYDTIAWIVKQEWSNGKIA